MRRIGDNLDDENRHLMGAAVAASGSDGEASGIAALIEVLGDWGVILPAGAVADIEAVIDAEATRRAGEAVRRIAMRLDGSAAAVALRRVLVGDQGESLREAAVGAGCSHVRIHALERKIRRRITGGVNSGSTGV